MRRRYLASLVLLVLIVCSGFLCAPASASCEDLSRIVYCSRTGSKYHYVSTCSNMSNPISMTLAEAKSKGRTPCAVCVHEYSGGSSSGSGESYGGFSDVNSQTPHANEIKWLSEVGISQGWPEPDGSWTFRGRDTVKRQDMAAFLYRLAGSPEYSAPEVSPFADVNSSTPHYSEICWLYYTGISEGWPVETGREFRGMDSVKRQDMAAFLERLSEYCGKAGYGEGVNPFADVDASTPHYHSIMWLVQYGVTEGWYENNGTRTFRGMNSIVRQDMAAFLYRMKNAGLC